MRKVGKKERKLGALDQENDRHFFFLYFVVAFLAEGVFSFFFYFLVFFYKFPPQDFVNIQVEGLNYTLFSNRSCGRLFCADCSEKSVPIPAEQLYTPVRVCDACYNHLASGLLSSFRPS